MTTRRQERVNSLIKHIVASFLVNRINTAKALVTVTRVEVSKDLRYAKIFLSVFPESEEKNIIVMIRNEKQALQSHLAKRLKTKFIPSLRFEIDQAEKKRQQVEGLL